MGCRPVGLAWHKNHGLKVVNVRWLDLLPEQLEEGTADISAVLKYLVLHRGERRVAKRG